jgi:hypothetical protein
MVAAGAWASKLSTGRTFPLVAMVLVMVSRTTRSARTGTSLPRKEANAASKMTATAVPATINISRLLCMYFKLPYASTRLCTGKIHKRSIAPTSTDVTPASQKCPQAKAIGEPELFILILAASD